jgi:hypothetical protein
MRAAPRALLAALVGCSLAVAVQGAEPVPEATPDCAAASSCWWFSGEYLVWFLREGRVPPLLTTGSFASGGRLGEPDTQVLYGDNRLETRHDDRFVGTRITLGWLEPGGTFGVEGRAFFLERDSTYFKATSDGSTLLARSYFNADGTSSSETIAGPVPGGWRDGSFVGYSRVELFGEEANAVLPLVAEGGLHIDALAGARFLQMRDRLDLTATGYLLPTRQVLFGLTDHWHTHDAYYGGQVGVCGEWAVGRWLLALRATVGLGGDDQLVQASGDRTFQTPAVRVVSPYGLAVQPSNAGDSERGDLDMVSEVNANVGYRLTCWARVYAGYTFLYWNNPIRAGDQVDLVINPNQPTPPGRPAIPFRTDNFWAQGVNVGLELRW